MQSTQDERGITEQPNHHDIIDNEDAEDSNVYYIHRISSREPYKTKLDVNNKMVPFEIDTGFGLTIISKNTYEQLFHNNPLQPCRVIVKSYTGENVPMLGLLKVIVRHQQNEVGNLNLYVFKGQGANLLGRNWLNVLKLNWNNIIKSSTASEHLNKVEEGPQLSEKLRALIDKHSALFSTKLGKVNGFKAKLNVKENAIPRFMKAMHIPYSLKEAVVGEIERLEKEGILKPVPYSNWASPIVIVTRPDGRIRMCGDFKRTLNPVLEKEEYPMPDADELFIKIQGGKKYSKIDLSRAYLQVELDEESQKFCVINTCKGLRQYTRMPYGIKPASGIFQKLIENRLKDIPMTVVKIDDILILEGNDIEHLKNLQKVFEVLASMGVTVNQPNVHFFRMR